METEQEEWMSAGAKVVLTDWVWNHADQWRSEGGDPSEIKSDVESHLWAKHEELDRVLEAEDLEGILGAMSSENKEAVKTESQSKRSFLPFGWLFKFHNRFYLGAWPLLIILIEAASGMFEGIVFDPISRMSQFILLLVVGGVAVLGQYAGEEMRGKKWFGFLTGVGLVPAIYWGVLCVPVVLMGGGAFVWLAFSSFGVGLLAFPIFLICMLIAGAPIFASLGLWESAGSDRMKGGWISGLGLGFLALLVVELPGYVTHYGLKNDDPALVREWGSEELLGQIAKEGTWGRSGLDTAGYVLNFKVSDLELGRRQNVDEVMRKRRFYYRVTGKDPLKTKSSFLDQGGKSSRSFDRDMGGDQVGGTVDGLALSESRLDGHIDGASGLGYWEWTMQFSNSTELEKEARMQVLLPPGGVVSRLTLWVNGEAQEAAFGAKSQVTAAYKSVVQRRRDPVLVRWVGGDRVLVQCYPVLPHATMKIRVGITAALDGNDRLFLPRFIERNFSFQEELATAVWVQGDVEMSMEGLEGKGAAGRWRETHGRLSLEGLTSKHTHVSCHDVSTAAVVWTEDQFANAEARYLLRERLPTPGTGARKVVLVVDGSYYFEDWHESFLVAVDLLRKAGHEVKIVYAAGEGVLEEGDEPEFVGGQDNLPALLQGLEVAREMKADELIWLHGGQPIELEDAGSFVQLVERGFSKVRISTMDLVGGPNRLLEQIQTSFEMGSAGRPAGPEDLADELVKAVSRHDHQYRYSRVPEGREPEGVKVWDQLARWQVWEKVMWEAMAGENRERLAKRAARYQLVTPVSGAVVLETQAQFDRFDLDQVEASTTPSIPGVPEPSSALLIFVSAAMLWRRRRRTPA